MGDTSKPTRDKGLYILTSQHPDDHDNPPYEAINGFGDFLWCILGGMKYRYITETIGQNRTMRVREQYSMWDGGTMKDGEHILTRTLDGKILITWPAKNKPECPKCHQMIMLPGDKLCYRCDESRLQGIRNTKTNACNKGNHDKCKGRAILWITGKPCACDCHFYYNNGYKYRR